jgi:hypothetical protein
MANTTNYNWETPDDTDLVKDGAAAIRTLGSSVDTTTKALNPSTTLGDIEYRSATANTNTRLGIGTTGQVLSVVGGVPAWATSDDADAIQNAIVDAKGDIVAASAADTPARLAVGTDNQRLIAASGETTGLKYVSDTQNTVIDAEGDLLVGDAADALQRLAIGSNDQVLTVDTSVDGKIKWATPAASSGAVAQVKSTSKTDTFTMTSNTYADITGLSVSITPTSASNKILIIASVNFNGDAGVTAAAARLMRGSTAIGIGDTASSRTPATSGGVQGADDDYPGSSSLTFLDSPATTSATTYKVQVRGTGGPSPAVYVNRGLADSDTSNNFRYISTITVMEVTP